MAKFFNDEANVNGDNKFFSDNRVVADAEEDTPSFVSASDATLINQQTGSQDFSEEGEFYSLDNNGSYDTENSIISSNNIVEQDYSEEEYEDNDTNLSSDQQAAFSNYQEEYLDDNSIEGVESEQTQYSSLDNETESDGVVEDLEQEFHEPSLQVPDQVDSLLVEKEEPFQTMSEGNLGGEKISTSSDENILSEENEETLDDNEEIESIEDSSMFANVETSYVVDNTYKGVDNTGKTGEDIKNPVYLDTFEKNDIHVSGNIFAVLIVLFEVLLSPGKSIVKNTHKYVNGKKAYKVFFNIVIYEFIFSLIGHIIGGCFVDKMSYGEFKKALDFSNVLKLNYLSIIIVSLVVIFGLVLLITLFNYASSFFSNKGLSFDTYLLIASLSFFPLILTINTFVPILNVMSIYLSIGLVIVALLFSLMIYINALWGIMEFKNENGKIFYSLISFLLMTIVLVIVLLVFFEDYVNAIKVVFK